jgi:hypothetical protein
MEGGTAIAVYYMISLLASTLGLIDELNFTAFTVIVVSFDRRAPRFSG